MVAVNTAENPFGDIFTKPSDSGFHTSMREKSVKDPLIEYALSFRGPGGIYRYADALGFVPNWQQKELMDAYDRC